MNKVKYIYWQDEEIIFGYLEDYLDYWTQRKFLDEIKENLQDIYKNLTSDVILS